jgi:hypothetical protein
MQEFSRLLTRDSYRFARTQACTAGSVLKTCDLTKTTGGWATCPERMKYSEIKASNKGNKKDKARRDVMKQTEKVKQT